MNSFLEKLLSLPKSIYVSYRLVGKRFCWRVPILVRYNVLVKSLKGRIVFENENPTFGQIRIGFNDINILDKKYQRTIIEISGLVHIMGRAFWGHGARLSVGGGGNLYIGENFINNAGGTIICFKHIEIGCNVLVSWNTMIMDTDFHNTIDIKNQIVREKEGNIIINDNCWICYGATVLKNTQLGKGSILSAGSIAKGKYLTENCVLEGIPAKVSKTNITIWRC